MTYYYNKILVPYDSSKSSDNAFLQAVKIVEMSKIPSQHDANIQIILLHVIQEIPIPPSLFTTGHSNLVSSKTGDKITLREHMKEIYQEIKADAAKMLNDKIGRYYNNTKQERKFDIKAKVSIGHTADKIIEFANEEKIDLIIMGTTGLTGVSKIKALGSVARKVSELAKCPIMLVR
ncbi:MAG: universal stress protein [Nitrososphaeraceae archaeon]|nr:universal stress protein [Nitrososphaeraceae archaeon]